VKIRIVLVRPRNPNNIGAAARAMANFGLDDLVVVDPYEPVWRETVAAVGGEKVMSGARGMSLDEALAGCASTVGTTTARRRRVDRSLLILPELPGFLRERLGASGRAAILFGSEKTGLPRAALERCAAWIKIPTTPESPSLNLGQAVAVVAYELSRAGAKR
jgi:tRNA/rRNA methyltransferase